MVSMYNQLKGNLLVIFHQDYGGSIVGELIGICICKTLNDNEENPIFHLNPPQYSTPEAHIYVLVYAGYACTEMQI